MDAIDSYLDEVTAAIRAISRSDVRAVVDALEAVWAAGATTYVIGNGGSASTASHMMNDLSKFTIVTGKRRFRAVALTDNAYLGQKALALGAACAPPCLGDPGPFVTDGLDAAMHLHILR